MKIARELKFYVGMIISGSKSVKKGQKFLKKATNWTFTWFFDKKICLANFKHINHINSCNLSKISAMSLYDFRSYFFPLGEVEVSFWNLLTTANNYTTILSDCLYQKSHLVLSVKGLMRVGNF